MKTKSKITLILLALFIYILGLAAGAICICYVPQKIEEQNDMNFVKRRARDYINKNQVTNWSRQGEAVIIYDRNGNYYRFYRETDGFFTLDFYNQTKDMVSEILDGNTTIKFYTIVHESSARGYCSRKYIGMRFNNKEGEPFVFIWCKKIVDLPEILLGFSIAFTIIFLIAFLMVLFSLNKQAKYVSLQKKYIDNITHELKTPVASVKALVEALSDGKVKTELERTTYYGMMLSETNQLQRMIQEALMLSKLQNKLLKIKVTPVDVSQIIENSCEKTDMLCELSDITFVVEDNVKNIPKIYADDYQFQKVISTLLDNAHKYTPAGGTITFSAEVDKNKVIFCVSDTGKGISKKDLPYVFERFYRAQRSDEISGSGLGLAIAKEVVLAMHGKIWIESGENLGTSVYFSFKADM